MKHCSFDCTKFGLHNRDDGIPVWWCHNADVKAGNPQNTAHMYEMSGWDTYASDTYTQPGHEGFGMVCQVAPLAVCRLVAPGQMQMEMTP